jgi:hypothetical protein
MKAKWALPLVLFSALGLVALAAGLAPRIQTAIATMKAG